MKKIILLTAFVASAAVFASTTGDATLSTTFDGALSSGVAVNTTTKFADMSSLDVKVDTKVLSSPSSLLGSLNSFSVKYSKDNVLNGKVYVESAVSGKDNNFKFTGDYVNTTLIPEVSAELNSATTFDNEGKNPKTETFLKLSNVNPVSFMKELSGTLTVDNNYGNLTDLKNIDKVKLDLVGTADLNSENTLKTEVSADTTIPKNEFKANHSLAVTYTNTSVDNLTLTGVAKYAYAYDGASKFTPEVSFEAKYAGVVTVDTVLSQNLVTYFTKANTSTTDLSVTTSSKFNVTDALSVTPKAVVDGKFVVDYSKDNDARFYGSTITVTPSVAATYKLNDSLTLDGSASVKTVVGPTNDKEPADWGHVAPSLTLKGSLKYTF